MVFAISLRSSTERQGDFSESVVFHSSYKVSCWFLVSLLWLVCVLLVGFCFALVTPSIISPFLHKWELPIKIKTERIDDRLSFKRARHGPKKKKAVVPVLNISSRVF